MIWTLLWGIVEAVTVARNASLPLVAWQHRVALMQKLGVIPVGDADARAWWRFQGAQVDSLVFDCARPSFFHPDCADSSVLVLSIPDIALFEHVPSTSLPIRWFFGDKTFDVTFGSNSFFVERFSGGESRIRIRHSVIRDDNIQNLRFLWPSVNTKEFFNVTILSESLLRRGVCLFDSTTQVVCHDCAEPSCQSCIKDPCLNTTQVLALDKAFGMPLAMVPHRAGLFTDEIAGPRACDIAMETFSKSVDGVELVCVGKTVLLHCNGPVPTKLVRSSRDYAQCDGALRSSFDRFIGFGGTTIGTHNVVEFAFDFPVYALGVHVLESIPSGFIRIVELVNYFSDEYVAIHNVTNPKRSFTKTEEVFFLPNGMTPFRAMRVRITFEWRFEGDGRIFDISLVGSPVATDPLRRPVVMTCPEPFRLSASHPMDQRRGDSECVKATCLDVCSDGVTFGALGTRRVFAVVETNNVTWVRGSWVKTLSFGVQLFRLADAFDAEGAIRVVAAEEPAAGGVVLRTRKGPQLPGTWSVTGELLSDVPERTDVVEQSLPGQKTFEGPISSVEVLGGQLLFVFGDGLLWVFEKSTQLWSTPSISLTQLIVNKDSPVPLRHLGVLGDRFVVLVAAHTVAEHDGFTSIRDIGQRVEQAIVDVYDALMATFVPHIFDHGVLDPSALLVHSRESDVLILDKITKQATMLSWKPVPSTMQAQTVQTSAQSQTISRTDASTVAQTEQSVPLPSTATAATALTIPIVTGAGQQGTTEIEPSASRGLTVGLIAGLVLLFMCALAIAWFVLRAGKVTDVDNDIEMDGEENPVLYDAFLPADGQAAAPAQATTNSGLYDVVPDLDETLP